MVKLIDSVNNFNQGVQCLNLSLLSNKFYYLSLLSNRFYCLLKLSKQRNFKNIFIGSWQYASWQPLGFERNIVYG